MTRYWRGMTNMAATKGQEVVIVRGEGATVWDATGKSYLDATASLWYCNVGHGRAEIVDAVAAQMRRLEAFHTFDVYANPPALALAEKIASLAPVEDPAVIFTPGGGSDAVDTAAKLTRRYWAAVGRPDKTIIVRRGRAYHGMNGYGTSLSGIAPNLEGLGTLIHEVQGVEWDSVEEVRALLERSADTIAAFIGEPVIGAGGIYPPPDGYWKAIAQLCRKHDVLLIADEVISGFGRLGTWFGAHRFGFRPDILTCAKGLTSGYLPLGGVVVSRLVREPFWDTKDAPFWRHGYTYGGHPVSCAAGLANIAIIERERLVERVAALEPTFDELVRGGFAGCPLVGEIRSVGLLAAVDVDPSVLAHDPTVPARLGVRARDHGLISRALGSGLQISPPFITTEQQLHEMVRRLRAAFDDILAAETSLQELVATATGSGA